MSKKSCLQVAVAAAFAVATSAAFAVDEAEPNDPISSAQRLDIPSGSVEVLGSIGTTIVGAAATADVDFYYFDAGPGSVVTIDIDNGIKATGGGRSVDTVVAVFDSQFRVLQQNDDVLSGVPLDEGSRVTNGRFDAYLPNVLLSKGGRYYVGVTHSCIVSRVSRTFGNGGTLSFPCPLTGTMVNGSYKLNITGVLPNVQLIDIAIKPGSGDSAPVNPKSRGNIPVALLSSADFDALKVDTSIDALTFGGTGDERSLLRCNTKGEDVNGDGMLDLVCHFDNAVANFTPGALEAHLKGRWEKGAIEGKGFVRIVGAEPKE